MQSEVTRYVLKIMIAQAAVGLFLFYRIYDRHAIERGRRWLAGVLVVLAAAAVYAYFDFGVYGKFGHFMNPHDFYHYYLGSKYAPEVGYLNLYNCTVAADAELTNGAPPQKSVRSMETYQFVPVKRVLAKRQEYRSLFSDARWEAFKHDVSYFKTRLGPNRWPPVVRDKGYNATPVWNMVAGLFSNHIPTDSSLGMWFLVSLDLILLTVMFALVGWAFGSRATLFSVVFFGTVFMMAYTHIRGAFLRLDWLAMLVMAVCFVKRERYKTAGALMAYAGLARVFPLIFVFGLGVKFVVDVFRTRRLKRRYVEFFSAFGLTLVVLAAASVFYDGGIGRWHIFLTKIRLHDADLSPIRVGFKYVFLMTSHNPFGTWAAFEKQKLQSFEGYKAVWWAIQFLVLGASAYLVRKLEDYETIPFGYVPAFFLTAPTFYYQVMILVSLFLFLPKPERLVRALGVAYLFALSCVMLVLAMFLPLDLTLSFSLSCLLLLLTGYMMVTAWLTPAAKAPGGSPVPQDRAPEPRKGPKHGKKRRR